jgi:hypothetical protein
MGNLWQKQVVWRGEDYPANEQEAVQVNYVWVESHTASEQRDKECRKKE